MAIEYGASLAVFVGIVGVDEAEGLLRWLQDAAGRRVDFGPCVHLHAANLQVLIAAKAPVDRWPEDGDLRFWLESVLSKGELNDGENNTGR